MFHEDTSDGVSHTTCTSVTFDSFQTTKWCKIHVH